MACIRALGVKISEGMGSPPALYPPSFSSSSVLWASKAWTRALEPEGKLLPGSLVLCCRTGERRREVRRGEVDSEISAEKRWTNLFWSLVSRFFVCIVRIMKFLQLFQQEGLVFSLLRKEWSVKVKQEISEVLISETIINIRESQCAPPSDGADLKTEVKTHSHLRFVVGVEQ